MYIRNKASVYQPGLYISKATKIKVVVDMVSIWDAAKKKGFKLYYNKEMPSRKVKVELVNYSRN